MNLHVEWGRPIQLKDASKDNMIYGLDPSKVTDGAGVYIVGRRWGSQFEALYVGKAGNIRSRVKGHLNNLRLMQHLHKAKTGRRIVLYTAS
jgi:excinuclease UvrABC nuclease subunit